MTAGPLVESTLPLPLLRKGKVREVYDVDEDTVLLVASDRISAFDVVMKEPIPYKGAVLTQMSAYWFRTVESITASHFIEVPLARGLDGLGRKGRGWWSGIPFSGFA